MVNVREHFEIFFKYSIRRSSGDLVVDGNVIPMEMAGSFHPDNGELTCWDGTYFTGVVSPKNIREEDCIRVYYYPEGDQNVNQKTTLIPRKIIKKIVETKAKVTVF